MTSAKTNLNAEKVLDFKSIRFRTWVYFFLMAVIILLVLWTIQIFVFKAYYQSMKKQEIERVGSDVIDRFPGRGGDPLFQAYIDAKAFNSGVNIVAFSFAAAESDELSAGDVTQMHFWVEYRASPFHTGGDPVRDDPTIIEDHNRFFNIMLQSERFSYITGERDKGNYCVYGAKLGGPFYLYMSSPLEPMDATTSVLTNQLLIVTIICLLLSIVLSWYISSRISRPISEFSTVARRLAKGDYSVKFEGNGYTEIEDLADTLNYATEEMGKTEALRRDFLANVSHDLRTPLTMVKAYAEMIRDISGCDAHKRTEHSQVIIDEADRLTNLVNDILNLSKLQAGTEQLETADVDMGVLVRVVLERFDIYHTRDGYTFIDDVDADCIIHGDSKRLEQVMYNLIGNAINYTGDNKQVRIYVKKQQGKVYVAVCDSGKGIAPDEIDAVWERYYRASQRKREVVGSGLGLSIVKNILIAHRAEYGIESEVGKGTAFWFTLPAAGSNQALLLPDPAGQKRRGRRRKESTVPEAPKGVREVIGSAMKNESAKNEPDAESGEKLPKE